MGDFAGIPHKLEPSLEVFLRQREHLHQVEKVFKALTRRLKTFSQSEAGYH